LEERYPDYPHILPDAPFAIEMGRSLSRTLAGRNNTTLGINVHDATFIPKTPTKSSTTYSKAGREVEFITQMLLQSNVFLTEIARVWNAVPRNKVEYAKHEWSKQFADVARLIAGGLKTRLYLLNTALWDFHHNQLADQAAMLKDLSQAIYSFQRDIEAFGISKRVVVLTISEFGRRLETTKSGTDHGGASSLMLVGEHVNAGILGKDPNCSNPDAQGNIRWEYDFRQMYASLLAQWLGAKPHEIMPTAVPHLVRELPLIKNRRNIAEELFGEREFVLLSTPFPNPASHLVYCSLKINPKAVNFGKQNIIVSVRDMAGNLVLTRQINCTQIEQEMCFDVSRWTSGQYIIHAESTSFKRAQILTVVR